MEQQLLTTPDEVITLAFPGQTGLTAAAFPASAILTSQEKFLKPVLNGLYPELVNGRYADLCEDYIKPALAHFARYTAIPQLACSVGDLGITTVRSDYLSACPEDRLKMLRRAARAEAAALLRRAVEHIEENADSFPEYDPKLNVLNRVSIASRFVL
ncbi:MAG: hypothetical protein LIO85_04125 [Rikenellaceae bacterium]|nr:hypothetical protein [Rikenellaceae bacterium]